MFEPGEAPDKEALPEGSNDMNTQGETSKEEPVLQASPALPQQPSPPAEIIASGDNMEKTQAQENASKREDSPPQAAEKDALLPQPGTQEGKTGQEVEEPETQADEKPPQLATDISPEKGNSELPESPQASAHKSEQDTERSPAIPAKAEDHAASQAEEQRRAEVLHRQQEASRAQREAEFKAQRQAAEWAGQRAAAQAQQAAQQASEQAARQAAQQAYERVAPPRRAASARASQSFKQQAEYFDESPPDSPIDEPPVKKPTPKPKPAPKVGGKANSAQAWEEPPQRQLALKLPDVTKALVGKWLQLYWPDDGKWWPGQVLSVDSRKRTVTLLYETGEEESNLELSDLIRKGEVAWMHAKDMPKEKEPSLGSGPRRPGRGAATWRSDSFDDEEEELPSASTSRGQAGYRRRPAEEEDDEEEAWAPGQKRKAALKSKAKYRDESEEESSYSESPPPSDQSSDWHSSEDDDKPRRKPKKKKKKPMSRPQPHAHHQQQAQPRQSHMSHQLPGGGGGGGGNMFGRGGIFDEGPPFGSAFGGAGGGLDPLRLPGGQAGNPAMSRDALQGGFPIERGWGVMTGAPNNAAGYRGAWPGQDLNQLFQNRQQLNNNGMGHLHIPQVSMQAGGGLDLSRLGANPAMMGPGGPTISQGQWRAPGMSSELMGAADWASQLGSQAMFRLPQMAQQQVAQQQLAAQQQQLQAQRLQQQKQAQQQQQQQQQSAQQGASEPPSRQVEVQHAPGQWVKGTIMACLSKGSSGGSVMVCYDDGRQEQLLAAEEGRSFNIRTV